MEQISLLRESILNICEGYLLNNLDTELTLARLKEKLDTVKKLEYDNCSVELFEILLDEELLLDILINKDMLDIDTFNEVVANKEAYLNGTHTFKKFLDGLI
ncbi:MAG: hypothetical protein ACRC28_02225 [Clostridium sp.]|uniref:hypothetical protein n=1 Tax=Clostridium sp. TaxID=1506 RepID=UPI003F3B66CF